jgi:hypothetical protein
MVFLVIVCIDSYIYTRKKNAHASLWGVPPLTPPRDQKMDPGPIETHV